MRDKRSPVRWSVEQRVRFAARRLYWDGTINREDLMRRFNVSPNQATTDLARLRELHKETITYDTVSKRYVAAVDFTSPEADVASLLTELRLIAEGHLDTAESMLSHPPPLALAEAPVRAVPSQTLKQVLAAIRTQRALSSRYRSFQRKKITRRILSPHALVFDGFRWHARAHDAGDDTFKDFLLARLLDVEDAGEGRADETHDKPWWSYLDLTIAPHPGLEEHQAEIVALDYCMDDSRHLTLTVREAVSFYVKKRLGLLDGHHSRPPQEQQIVLVGESPVEYPDF